METILDAVLAWLTDEQVVQVIGTVGALVALLGTIWAAIRMLAPRVKLACSKSFNALRNAGRGFSFGQRKRLHCLRLRWAVLFSNPETILKLVAWRLEEENKAEFAYATGILGNIEEAKALNSGQAAWAIALVRDPFEALEYIRPKKSLSSGNLVAFQGLEDLTARYQSEDEVKEWQETIALINRLACTIDAIFDQKKEIAFPKNLDDASIYVKSKPKRVGLVGLRDPSLLKPVDLKRLRAIRWLVARSINCASLQRIAIQVMVLVSLEERYRSDS